MFARIQQAAAGCGVERSNERADGLVSKEVEADLIHQTIVIQPKGFWRAVDRRKPGSVQLPTSEAADQSVQRGEGVSAVAVTEAVDV
jgi:hypothetical protein